MLEHYNEVIQDQLDKNIIEVVEEDPALEVGKVHYLPHHEVVHLDKSTTKVHVVFDASCKRNGPSLNDCLYAGPPLTPLNIRCIAQISCPQDSSHSRYKKGISQRGGVERSSGSLMVYLGG